MKILQISSAKSYGGGEKHLVDLCRGLHDKGHEVFLALRKENEFEERLSFIPAENRLHVALRNALDLLSTHKVSRFLRDCKIDIVHAHLARDYPPASMAVRLYPNSKLVVTRHVLFPMKGLHKLVLQNVSKAIAVSTAVEANLNKTFPVEKVVCIPNGIEVEKWSGIDRENLEVEFRKDHNIRADSFLIGTVGELKPLKGQEDFVLAAAEIVKQYPASHFVIVGKDNSIDKSYRRKLKRLVKVFELEEQFTFLDWIEDTSSLLSALDIFVSPSHSESFGLAILEAMASGIAVVSTDTAGASELIIDGETGILVPIKTPVKLAQGVCGLLENEKRLKDLGANAEVFARENFSLQKMVSQTEGVYTSLTTRPS